MTPLPPNQTSLKTPLITLLNVILINFAGSLHLDHAGKKYAPVCVEYLTVWQIVVSTSNCAAGVAINFVCKNILELFGPPGVIFSDNGTYFTATILVAFMNGTGTKWGTMAAYAPMSNGRAERIVGAIKLVVGKKAYGVRNTWVEKLPPVSYGCRRRHLDSGLSPFELTHGVVSRMSYEPDTVEKLGNTTEEHLISNWWYSLLKKLLEQKSTTVCRGRWYHPDYTKLEIWYSPLADNLLLLLLSGLFSVLDGMVPVKLSWKGIPITLQSPRMVVTPVFMFKLESFDCTYPARLLLFFRCNRVATLVVRILDGHFLHLCYANHSGNSFP